MLSNSTKLLLTNTMMIGVIMTICTNNWFSMWMGLEITMLSFIPMMQTNKIISCESMIKYFIIQSVASTMMLLSVSTMLIGVNMENEMLMMISMLIKIGSAPFHNWVLMIIETLNYNEIWIMLTIVKLPPLTILYQINTNHMNIPIIMGMILSSISCLNQSSMRKTLGYSSIYNMALLMMTTNKYNTMITFMFLYSIMLALLINLLKKLNVGFINQMVFNEKNSYMKINLWINMLSMAGFPPTMGFVSKIMVMQIMILNNKLTMTALIIMTSMLVMLFYMRLAFTSMLSTSISFKWKLTSQNLYFSMILNTLTFPVIISLTSVL